MVSSTAYAEVEKYVMGKYTEVYRQLAAFDQAERDARRAATEREREEAIHRAGLALMEAGIAREQAR